MAARKKEEMIEQLQSDIANYEALKRRRDQEEITATEFHQTLRRGGFNNEDDFEATYVQTPTLHRADAPTVGAHSVRDVRAVRL